MTLVTTCCGAPGLDSTDICTKCGEHTSFYDEEAEEDDETEYDQDGNEV